MTTMKPLTTAKEMARTALAAEKKIKEQVAAYLKDRGIPQASEKIRGAAAVGSYDCRFAAPPKAGIAMQSDEDFHSFPSSLRTESGIGELMSEFEDAMLDLGFDFERIRRDDAERESCEVSWARAADDLLDEGT